MLAANIIAPSGVLCGACNIIVTLFEPVEILTEENINLSGDVDDVVYNISGKDRSWVLAFSFPNDAHGKMAIALLGDVTTKKESKRLPLETVVLDVEYDTCHIIPARWGDVVYEKNKVILPIALDEKIVGLTAEYFSIETGGYDYDPQLYEVGDTGTSFQLEFNVDDGLQREIIVSYDKVSLDKRVLKENGNLAHLQIMPITIPVVETA